MKLTDIKKKYKNRWVLAKVIKEDETGQALEVEPITTAKSKAEIEAKIETAQAKHVTVVYTGKPKARI